MKMVVFGQTPAREEALQRTRQMIDNPAIASKIVSVYGLVFILSLGFIGCASKPRPNPGDPTLPEIDVLRLKDDAVESLKLANENKAAIQSLQAKVNVVETRLDGMPGQQAPTHSAELQNLQAQVESLKNELKLLAQQKAVPAAPPTPVATFKPKSGEAPVVKAEAVKPDPVQQQPEKSVEAEKPAVPKQTPPKTGPKPHSNAEEANLYKRAFDHYYARQYVQSIDTFGKIIQKFPKGNYVDDSHYWVGECHFAMGNFAKAIASFRTVFTFEGTEKADDAQLKLGYSYLRLGDKRRATEEFQKLISLYPDSDLKNKAKEELDQLR